MSATGAAAGAVWLRPLHGGAHQLVAHAGLRDQLCAALTSVEPRLPGGAHAWDSPGWLAGLGPSDDLAAAALPADASGEAMGTLVVWADPRSQVGRPPEGWCDRARERLPAIVRQLGRVVADRVETDSLGLRLQASIGALVGADTVREVARAVLQNGMAAVGASRGVLYRVSEDAAILEPAASFRSGGSGAAIGERLPVSQSLPPSEAVRTGLPIFVGSAEELARRYPAFDRADVGGRAVAVAALPLNVHSRSYGTLVYVFAAPRTFPVEERAFFVALAQQCELALERVRLSAEARAAREAKSEFLAVMSHELRTPLNAILGHAELIVDGILGPVSELQRMHLTRLQRSGRELLGLVEEVLTLTKVEAGADTDAAQLVDLSVLVREAVATLEPVAAERGIRIRALVESTPEVIETDVDKTRHIVRHLISNAIKFTERGEVTIALFSDADGIECEVRDTGIGIASEHLEHIFEPFWQVERSHTRRAGGMGLGLHITRRFARLLGGDVLVESRKGGGSTFTLRLPRSARKSNPVPRRSIEAVRDREVSAGLAREQPRPDAAADERPPRSRPYTDHPGGVPDDHRDEPFDRREHHRQSG